MKSGGLKTSNFSEDDLQVVLRFTNALADKINGEANFLDDEIDDYAKAVAERKNSGSGGRVLIDKTDEDREIREQVRSLLKKRKRTGEPAQLIIKPGARV